MPSLVLESTWANAGGTVIIYLAALTGVNPELYEAASVDGAGLWKKVWHVTLPQLRTVLLVTMILQIIGTAQVFLEPYLFTSGGPANATMTVLLLIYNYAFGNSLGASYGEAAALSLMLVAFLAVFSLIYLRATRSWSTRMSALQFRSSGAGSARRPRASRGWCSTADWRRPSVKWGLGRRTPCCSCCSWSVGLGPILWLGQGSDHADAGHAHEPDGALPARLRLEQHQRRVERGRRRPLHLEHGRDRFRVLALPDHRRDDGRLRALGAAPEVREA